LKILFTEIRKVLVSQKMEYIPEGKEHCRFNQYLEESPLPVKQWYFSAHSQMQMILIGSSIFSGISYLLMKFISSDNVGEFVTLSFSMTFFFCSALMSVVFIASSNALNHRFDITSEFLSKRFNKLSLLNYFCFITGCGFFFSSFLISLFDNVFEQSISAVATVCMSICAAIFFCFGIIINVLTGCFQSQENPFGRFLRKE